MEPAAKLGITGLIFLLFTVVYIYLIVGTIRRYGILWGMVFMIGVPLTLIAWRYFLIW